MTSPNIQEALTASPALEIAGMAGRPPDRGLTGNGSHVELVLKDKIRLGKENGGTLDDSLSEPVDMESSVENKDGALGLAACVENKDGVAFKLSFRDMVMRKDKVVDLVSEISDLDVCICDEDVRFGSKDGT
ncbi:hypothetical protein V6N13_130764 [Hibiscus sabdariffa]|uniref:Uncharacterized protein n=1 Tax=Hibiscus sabdariffa TaxID=183260 RepID=A0ABR2BQX9_9ROSI